MLVERIKITEDKDGNYIIKINGRTLAVGITKLNIDFTVRPVKISTEYHGLHLTINADSQKKKTKKT